MPLSARATTIRRGALTPAPRKASCLHDSGQNEAGDEKLQSTTRGIDQPGPQSHSPYLQCLNAHRGIAGFPLPIPRTHAPSTERALNRPAIIDASSFSSWLCRLACAQVVSLATWLGQKPHPWQPE